MSIAIVTQARISSSRLPQKVLLPLGEATVLDLHLKRLKKSKLASQFVVATTAEQGSERILAIAKKHGFSCYQGDVNDVLQRFYLAVKDLKPTIVVRVTSDCPLIDPVVVDRVISEFQKSNVDYASNVLNPTYPDGVDCEVFSFAALERAYKEAKLQSEREHVTPYIWKNSDIKGGSLFKAKSVESGVNYTDVRLTLDYKDDHDILKALVDSLGEEAGWLEYANAAKKLNPASAHSRNEGYTKSVKGEGS